MTNKIEERIKRLKDLHEPGASSMLAMLLSADLVFFIAHWVSYSLGPLRNPLLDVAFEGGYPEVFQYLKYFWITYLLINIAIKNKSFHYVPWALVSLFFLLDDSLAIHERLGHILATRIQFDPPLGLDAREFGELTVIMIVGLILLPLILWAYFKGSPAIKRVNHDIALIVAVLVFFSVILDAIVPTLSPLIGWKATDLLTFVEDSGEMLTASILLWYIFYHKLRGSHNQIYLLNHMPNRDV